jgi:hypothetical protein
MLNFLVSTFVGHILQRYLRHKDFGDTRGSGCIGYPFVCKILDFFFKVFVVHL